jgi:hypothetical protein
VSSFADLARLSATHRALSGATAAQKRALLHAFDRSCGLGDESGFPASTLSAMARKGLIREYEWSVGYYLTDLGRAVAEALSAERNAR